MKTNPALPPCLRAQASINCLKVLCWFIVASLCYLPAAHAQRIPKKGVPAGVLFRSGAFSGPANIREATLVKDSLRSVHYKKKYYTFIQFDKLPGVQEKKELAALGYRLFDYIPGRAFLAEMPDSFSTSDLKRYGAGGVYPLPATVKLSAGLLKDPEGYLHESGKILGVSYFGSMSGEEVQKELEQAGATVVPTKVRPEHVLFVRAGKVAQERIAALPFVSYLAVQPMRDLPLNYNNRAAHGVDAIGAVSGRNLQGDGVTLGIGDNADPYTHIDFTGRLIDRFAGPVDLHGTHTTGTAAGGGILDPRYKGMAPHADIVSQYYSDILVNAATYISDYDMLVTNNSYTDYNGGCSNDGEYDYLANYLDAQLDAYPNLMHDFAAGNDGSYVCTPYPSLYATIKSGFQCAKNIMTVGNVDNSSYQIYYNSSCGPTNDGRLKPEVVAGGTNIISTTPYNTYTAETGTSMSSPTITGTWALLCQRYRQLHGNADPSAALIKALVCNNATDLGNPGPDFIYGFGNLNALTAVQAMENNQYVTGTMNNGDVNTITIPGLPSGLQQVKIMLYWPDAPAAPYAASALVNDLDLTVTSPDATVHYPLVLSTDPNHLADNAAEGPDHLNNIEQVVINNPPGGSFTVTVNGYSIPAGPQNYVVTYQLIQPSVTLTYPYGNDTWVPGQTETIRWDAYGGDPNTFTIEYSADNGSTWTTIDNAVPSTTRLYPWTTPAVATNQGLIRVTRNGTTYSDVSHYNFTILGQPVITLTNPCQGYAQLIWNTIPSATSYDIMELTGDSMQKIASTIDTSYLLGNLNRDSSYWLAVRAVNNTTAGRRSVAGNISPSGGTCTLTALDNDLTIDSVIAPLNGRQFTSSQLSNATAIQVEIKNLGTIPTGSALTLNYQVNGGTVVTETSSGVVPANGGVFDYTFTNTYDFSAPGYYNVQIWVNYPGDPQTANDTFTTVIKQLQNAPLTLAPSYTEGFESATDATYLGPALTMGLTGLDRADFIATDSNGRMRTFINTGFARTGDRAATLDEAHFSSTSSSDSLITTFNLSNYSASDQIWLDFYYNNRGIDFSLPGNQVWIRGNDQAAWIPVYTLDISPGNIGVYQASSHIDVTGTLAGATPVQTISSSFQIKFGEQGYTSTNSVIPDGDLDDGYSFDDITLTRSTADIGILSMPSPNLTGICGLSNAETISVKVKNFSSINASNIPVTYSINGVTVTESIPSINAFDSVVYTFTQTADLSAYQGYTLDAWVAFPGDTYHANDTLLPVSFQTTPLIATFPYLEGFESNNGYWYTNGVNDSWQWGTPAKTIINRAANGTKCWVTSLTGDYNNNELSYLYSPCFNISSLTNPVLSFSHIFQTEDDCDCDYHWAEYSTDGVTWIKLGAVGSGTNWYDNATRQAWQLSDTIWHVSSYAIPPTAGTIRFRIVMSSDPATTYEGVGIDDVHIYDDVPIYNGANISSGLTQPVSGSSWVNFDVGGSRTVSINPNGQNLGNTNVEVFMYPGAVRNDGVQYYLNRNIVIQPANPPASAVSVRYYFLDAEVNSLINASGCATCTSILDAYSAGITQFHSSNLAEEDSVLSNDTSGVFQFFLPHTDLSIVPYDNGYYAEYQVSGFSEFWIDNGGPTGAQPLPLTLLSFTAARAGSGALLQWSATGEETTSRYLIEKSGDGVIFTDLDSVQARGTAGAAGSAGTTGATANYYQYTDNNLLNGVNYYRLKIESIDGKFTYSPVRTVDAASGGWVVSVFPNPIHAGTLYISSSSNCQKVQLTDVSGRVILQTDAHGFLVMLPVGALAKGIYFVSVQTDAGLQVQRILVE